MSAAKGLAALGCAGLIASTAAACGTSDSGGADGTAKPAITMGTTNTTTTLDPAGAYDTGSWMVLYNTHQQLLSFPSGATQPQPDAAQSCHFQGSDYRTYVCTLKDGLKFANGDPLTAQDVAFTFTRMKRINYKSGPAGPLFGTLQSTEAKGRLGVVFHLSEPDAVFPSKLASAAGSIVDHAVYPADSLLPNARMVGSGPYKVASVESKAQGGQQVPTKIALVANPNYHGQDQLNNGSFTLRFFDDSATEKQALDAGQIDIADNNGLDPKAITAYNQAQLANKGNIKVVSGDSSQIRVLVFNVKDHLGGQRAIRQAVSQLLDRKALARDIYDRNVQALYSMVPQGIGGHNTAFFDQYGDPSVAKAHKILARAGIATPVPLNIAWSRAAAGQAEADELKRQLETGGLFKVSIRKDDWGTFQANWQKGVYESYTVGWSPDYPDADDFIAPLVIKGGAYSNGYDNPLISQKLIPETRKEADRTAAAARFDRMQNVLAQDAPIVPLWQSKAFYCTQKDITGVESTVDVTGVFRFWEIGKGPQQ